MTSTLRAWTATTATALVLILGVALLAAADPSTASPADAAPGSAPGETLPCATAREADRTVVGMTRAAAETLLDGPGFNDTASNQINAQNGDRTHQQRWWRLCGKPAYRARLLVRFSLRTGKVTGSGTMILFNGYSFARLNAGSPRP